MRVSGYLSWCAASVLFALAMMVRVADAEDRPNILLVMADDLGWTDIGSYGGEIDTPNLDELAEQGLKFTDFHVSVSCSPTRSMLMSGNDNHIAGLGNMGELLTAEQRGQPGYEGYLNDRVASMAEVLRDAGYNTYMAGKWHLGHETGKLPFDRGFDATYSMLVGGASHWGDRLGLLPDDDPAAYSSNGKKLDRLPQDFYSSRSFVDFLMDAIRKNGGDGKPFFAYLAFTAPHDPVHAPEPWLSKYKGRYDQGYGVLKKERWTRAKELGLVPKSAALASPPPGLKPWNQLTDDEKAFERRRMEVYAGMLEAMDYNYGRMIDFISDIGELENTVIIFLSDNGANPWYSNEYPDADKPGFVSQFDNSLENIGRPRSNHAYGMGFASGSGGPLDRFKMTVGEGGIRVPLLIAGPGIQKGGKTAAFTYVWDILPTVLEFAKAEYPKTMNGRTLEQPRGRSMMPLLTGKAERVYNDEDLVGGELGGGKWMRQGAFKAVLIPEPYGDGTWRLFNVVEDPGEAKDLSSQMPKHLEKLIAAWNDYAKEVGVVLSK